MYLVIERQRVQDDSLDGWTDTYIDHLFKTEEEAIAFADSQSVNDEYIKDDENSKQFWGPREQINRFGHPIIKELKDYNIIMH